MSAEIISLSKARKDREKAKAAKTTAANRARFGRTKAQKIVDKAKEDLRVRRLDQAKRDDAQRDPQGDE